MSHVSESLADGLEEFLLARVQPYLWFVGMMLFSFSNHITGLMGMPRRVYDASYGGSTVAAYTAQRLWEPLGAEQDGFYIMDGPPGTGREFSGAGFNATLRDFARIGQMMLDGGRANGRQIVSPEWVRQSTTSTFPASSPLGGYGYQWWLMGSQGAYSALGLQGQRMADAAIGLLPYWPASVITLTPA